jgi:serine/threonine-protein kinase RsbW
MTPQGPPLTLTFPSDLRFLGVARAFVEAVCTTGGLSRTATDAVVLATNEATSNVIRHAHHDHPGAQVQIVCRLCAEGIEVCLRDEGEPFDLDAVPHLNPAEIRLGGRGVFLMRRLMDELTCEARGEGGNVLRMVKRYPCERPRSAG